MRKWYAPALALCLLLTGCATVSDYASPTPALGQEAEPTPAVSSAPEGSQPPEISQSPEGTPPPAPVWGEQVYLTGFAVQDREEPVFSPEYRLPKIENADGVPAYEAVNSYYADALEELAVSAAELSGWAVEDYNLALTLGNQFYNYVDSESYVLSLNTAARVSVLRTHVSNLGTPYPTTYPVGDTFDMTTGARLSFADLFTCSEEEAQDRVLSAVLAQNAQGSYAGTVIDEDSLRAAYWPQWFYLTEDSLVVYFPQGELSAALGSPTFAIPYTELEDILTPWE